MTDEERDKIVADYNRYAHAMQSGVAAVMNYEPSETTPKHLRVGVNSAMVDSSSLAQLLMRKGLITEEEYLRAIRDGMKDEYERYRERLRRITGAPGLDLG